MEKSAFFAHNIYALDEFMGVLGFLSVDVDDPFEDERKYIRDFEGKMSTIVIKSFLVNSDKSFINSFKKEDYDKGIIYREDTIVKDDDLPF